MADKIIVKKFGPIEHAELEIKKTTVLIGSQGSGKSTLAKLVAIFKDKPAHGSVPKSSNFSSETIRYSIQNYGSEDTFISYKSSKIEATVQGHFWDYKELENKITVETVVFIPTERILLPIISESILSLLNNNINLPPVVINFGSRYEYARKRSNGLSIAYLGIEYQLRGNDEWVIKQGKPLKLNESSSGFQSILPLSIVVTNFMPELTHEFIIEEPELNLFPTTQKDLMHYLIATCTKDENELMMTTHSPYILATLNNQLFAYQVAKKFPEKWAEINAIIPQQSWINPEEFAAYFVGEGTVRSIINPKTGLISENELDEVSEIIGDEFDALKRIYLSKNYATSH